MYTLLKGGIAKNVYGAKRDNGDGSFTSFVFDPANTDYAAFRAYLSTPNASLQDATGTAMTAQQIATFLGTLP